MTKRIFFSFFKCFLVLVASGVLYRDVWLFCNGHATAMHAWPNFIFDVLILWLVTNEDFGEEFDDDKRT